METADVWKREGDKLSCEINVMVTKDNDFLVTWLMYPKRMVDMSDGGWKMEKVDIGLRFPKGQLESGRFKRRFYALRVRANCQLQKNRLGHMASCFTL
jgi:hypothetical protein